MPSGTEIPARARRDTWQAARRGLALRCPNCGRGQILAGYLKPAEACTHCSDPLGRIRADDGPAWATILLVGHIISPLFFLFALESDAPEWAAPAFVGGLAVVLTLVLLPRMKGLFIAMIWATRASADEAARESAS